jgi:squalene synthase HpnC
VTTVPASSGRHPESLRADGVSEQTFAPIAASVMAQAGSENFPVASRLLPRATRTHLLALYGFARLIDDAGDEAQGDRLALLDELESDLERAWQGTARAPLIARLEPTIVACQLPIDPFRRLIEANRRDQVKHRYETFDELLGYCALSANPVGELVLRVFGAATPERLRCSDAICTALQLTEHWQDIAEDYGRGRIYLPAADLERYAVAEAELGAATPTPAFKRLLAYEVDRTRELLEQGSPLVGMLRGRPSFAVAAFAAGGRAALTAIRRAGYDVLGSRPRPGPTLRAGALLATLLHRRST